jgi:hypothetical protein
LCDLSSSLALTWLNILLQSAFNFLVIEIKILFYTTSHKYFKTKLPISLWVIAGSVLLTCSQARELHYCCFLLFENSIKYKTNSITLNWIERRKKLLCYSYQECCRKRVLFFLKILESLLVYTSTLQECLPVPTCDSSIHHL